MRALERKGLESEVRERMMQSLRHNFDGLKRAKDREMKEQEELAKAEERKKVEQKAMEEAKVTGRGEG